MNRSQFLTVFILSSFFPSVALADGGMIAAIILFIGMFLGALTGAVVGVISRITMQGFLGTLSWLVPSMLATSVLYGLWLSPPQGASIDFVIMALMIGGIFPGIFFAVIAYYFTAAIARFFKNTQEYPLSQINDVAI